MGAGPPSNRDLFAAEVIWLVALYVIGVVVGTIVMYLYMKG